MIRFRGAVLEHSASERPYERSKPLRVREVSADEPGPTECLVRIEAAGICHSDLSVVDGTRPRPMPTLLGHEACGQVIRVGVSVADFVPGDRVVLTFLPRCESCRACRGDGRTPCELGSSRNGAGELLSGGSRLYDAASIIHHHLGVSAFAEYAVVDRRSLVHLPSDVPSEVGALLGCAVLTGGGAVWNAARPLPGARLVVLGLGGVGMAALLTALTEPDVEVVGVDPIPGKRDLAVDLGAARALSPEEALSESLHADVVIEASGHPDALGIGIQLLGPGGVLAATGLTHPTAITSIPNLRLVAEALTIRGCYLGSSIPHRDIPRFVELWRQGRLPLERLISHRIGLDEINLAMDRLHSGEALRQVILPEESLQR